MQAVAILLEAHIITISTNKNISVYEYMIGIKRISLSYHTSESQMWELFLFFLSKCSNPTCSPYTYKFVHQLLTCQSILFEEQLYDALTFFFYLFISFAHIAGI